MKYDLVIDTMKRNGILFEQGLTAHEFSVIESTYDIHMPDGFYNWRGFSPENITHIKQIMSRPFEAFKNEADSIEWCEKWGKKPTDTAERNKALCHLIESAPKLIPVFAHRYIADTQLKVTPVFSVCGTDIIIYANDLESYLHIEFCKGTSDIESVRKSDYVTFWSDIIDLI